MTNRKLGRKIPTDFEHVIKYPLKAVLPQVITPAPMTWGINWYTDFDKPVKDKDGKYWVGKDAKNLGSIRGGHCVCSPQNTNQDLLTWWGFYDQGEEGACVGFGSSRMMSLLNRKRYDARWLWNEAKKVDEWPDTNPGDDNGTSVRAAMDVLRTEGHVAQRKGKDSPVNPIEGILANRWAVTVDEVLASLGNPYYRKIGAIPFLNSWGKYYPHVVWMPCETWQRLLRDEGEATRITDR